MGRWISLFAAVLALSTASSASALTFIATTAVDSGRPLDALLPGDLITVDVRMSNPSGVTIFGVGAGVQGWDNSILELVSAEMNPGPYFCTTALCSSGLINSLYFPTEPGTDVYVAGPADVQNIPGVGSYLPLVQAVSPVGRAGNGARDPGLDGVVNGGDAQFRLVFRMVQIFATTTLDIGTNANPILGNVVALAGGNTELAINALITVSIIPEPGTALLLGLGLAGLATSGRRA